MCICDLEVGEEDILARGCWTNLSIAKHRDGHFMIADSEDGEAYFKIEYCPKCGRKLKDE